MCAAMACLSDGVAAEVTRARAISSHMAEVLAEASRQKVANGELPAPVVAKPQRPEVPANRIVRLPAVVVTERRPPRAEEVLTGRALERVAMARFLGDETGLNRAMNTLTVKHLWNRIPVLGKFGLLHFETNEERAMRMYRAARQAERWQHVWEMQAMTVKPGTGPLQKR